MDRGRSRLIRWLRRAVLLLLALEALYLVAGNVALNSSRVRSLPNRRPERFSIRWGYGWTLWPGSVHLRDVQMRGTSRRIEWYARLETLATSTRLLPYLERRVHLRSVSVSGVEYLQRRRLQPAESPGTPESLPVIPQFEAPAGASAPPSSSSKTPRKPWTVVADRIEAGVDRLWIDRFKLSGGMNVETSMNLTVRGAMEFPQIRFEMSQGALLQGDREILGNLSLSADMELPEIVPKGLKGMSFFRLLTGRVHLNSESASLFFLESYFEKVPWLRFNGQSSLAVDLIFLGGVLQPGSRIEADIPRMNTRFLDRTLLGRGRIEGQVDEAEGERRAQIVVRLDEFALAASENDKPFAAGREFRVVTRSRSLDLDDLLNTLEVNADLSEAVIPDISWYNRYLPPDAGIEIRGGHGRIEYHIAGSEGEPLRGKLILNADDMAMRLRNYDILGDIKIDMSLHGVDLKENRFDVSGTSIDLVSDQFPWRAHILLPQAAVRFSEPLTAEAQMEMSMTDTTPLVAMFDAQKDISGFVEKLMTIQDIKATAASRVSELGVEIHDIDVSGEKLQILADFSLGKSGRNGIMYIEFGIFSLGVEIKDDEKDLDLVRARKWFEEQRAKRRGNVGSSGPQ